MMTREQQLEFAKLCIMYDYDYIHEQYTIEHDTVDKIYYNLHYSLCTRLSDDLKNSDKIKNLTLPKLHSLYKKIDKEIKETGDDPLYWEYFREMDTACRGFFGYMENLYSAKSAEDVIKKYINTLNF